MSLDYLIMLVYALVMLGLGWYGMCKAKSQNDFLVVGCCLGPGLYLGTVAAVVLGGVSTIGMVKLGYQSGLSGLWLVLMLGLGVIVLSLMFSQQIARLRAFTVTQALEQRYQASPRLIGGVVMVICDLMVVVTATIAIGLVTEVIFGIPWIPTIPCGGGIVIVYSVIGDMWPPTLTDIIRFVIETVGIFLVLLSLPIDGAGGLACMQEVLPTGFFDPGHIGLDTVLTYFLLYFFGALIGQDIWQRVFTARSKTVVHYAGFGAGVCCMLYGVTCALIGAATRVLLSDLVVPENAHAEITREVLAPGLRGPVVAAALSATTSTASECLLAVATVLQEDIYVRFLRPDATSDICLSRCITLLMGVAILVLACLADDVIAALSIAYNLLASGLLVSIVGALLWRRASPQGVIASIVIGYLMAIVCMAHNGLLANSPIVCGPLANLATFVAVGLATRPAASLRAQPK